MPALAKQASIYTRWTGMFAAEPLFAATGALLALSLLITLPAAFLDVRTLLGENIWAKPIKFQFSLSIYLLTLAFFARWLPKGVTHHIAYRIYAVLVVLCVVAEMAWIGGAAVYGTASHYNVTDPYLTAIYPVMGVIAVFLTSATLFYGVAIEIDRSSNLNAPMRLAVAVGLIMTFVATVIVASKLASLPGHSIGIASQGASLPILGWSREVGDLRVSHFFATHAMHAVPLAGLLASRLSGHLVPLAFSWLASAAYGLIILLTYVQAVHGLPFV